MFLSRSKEALRRPSAERGTTRGDGQTGSTRSASGRSGAGRLAVAGAVTAMTVGATLFAEPVASAENLAPVVKLAWSYPDGPLTVGTPVTLDASGSYDPEGEALTYQWEIASDPFREYKEATVVHRFDFSGYYDVTLTVRDASGNSSSASDTITVTGENFLPKPRLTQSPDGVVAPGELVTFDASGSVGSTDLAYQWSFAPEGQPLAVVGRGEIYQYAFPKAGLYDFELLVTDGYGASAPLYGRVRVLPAPVVNFTQSVASPIAPGTAVTFDASSSTGDSLKYTWRINGATVIDATNATFTNTFATAGTYQVSLIITDYWRRDVERSATVTVAESPTEPPVARFAQTPSSSTVDPDTEVTFDGSASTGSGLKYAWYVRGEKGIVSTDKILKYPFKRAGDYGIELRVTDTAGTISKKWTGLTVTSQSEPPVAKFSQTPAASSVDAGTKVTFDGSTSTGDGLTYAWYVRGEKGVVSADKVLNHTFKRAGDYGIQLVVTDAAGRSAKRWTGLKVTGTNNPPTAQFTQAPSSSTIKAGTAVTFDGSTSADPDGDQLKYYWFVRGQKGVVSTDKVLNHTFKKAGDYGVELRVVDPTGATSKKWIGLTVTG